MTRTLYLITLLVTSIAASFAQMIMLGQNETLAIVGALSVIGLIAVKILAGIYRWANMGYSGWWGLLTIIPFVSIYGLVMPPNAKMNGIDGAGKVWALLIAMFFVSIFIISLTATPA